jgi:fructose-1-phosphate kinase PfkB-like protein
MRNSSLSDFTPYLLNAAAEAQSLRFSKGLQGSLRHAAHGMARAVPPRPLRADVGAGDFAARGHPQD